MSNFMTLGNLAGQLKGRRVFLRTDFNVTNPKTGGIESDNRIRAALPTIEYLSQAGAITVIGSHNERPRDLVKKALAEGQTLDEAKRLAREKLTLRPVAETLNKIHQGVKFLVSTDPQDPINMDLVPALKGLRNGDVAMLENLRFYDGEEQGDRQLAEQIWQVTGSTVFVQEGFGCVHRSHSSIVALPQVIRENGGQVVAGFLVQREVTFLNRLLHDPQRPYVAFLGGLKVADKIGVIEELLGKVKVDRLVVAGAMIREFLQAAGFQAGADPLPAAKRKPGEQEQGLEIARKLIQAYPRKIVIPEVVLAEKVVETGGNFIPQQDIKVFTCCVENKQVIPDDYTIRDVFGFGLEDLITRRIINEVGNPATVVWNGPFGQFEKNPFGYGTFMLMDIFGRFRKRNEALLLIAGGGDTEKAIRRAQAARNPVEAPLQFDHISTGGGAMLEFLEGNELPGIAVLDEVKQLR